MHATPSRPTPAPRKPDPQQAQKRSQAALRTFFNIAQAWGLSSAQEEVLLGTSKSSLYNWKAGKVGQGLAGDTLERLGYVFDIYAALHTLLPVPERANAWLKQPNTAPLFGGGTALARLLGGQVGDLKAVADYLNAERGGDFA